jgi:class 3 adenylate cyclase/energy-coupling factor transporter ATP-binding protein EcfA2
MPSGAVAREQAAHKPKWVNARLQSQDRSNDPHAEARTAAVLLVDIAGFTAKTDRAAGDGAESLTYFINDCFAVLADVIDSEGGDIVAFAGDAILAIWVDPDAAVATAQAARCGLALRQAMTARPGREAISARTAIEAGEVFFCRLGGWQDKWHYVAAGDPFYSIGLAYQKAAIGDIALCANAARLSTGSCEVEPMPYGARLLGMRSPGAVAPIDGTIAGSHADEADASDWVGEFRTLTVARVGLPDFSFDDDFLKRLQAFVVDVQQIAERLEGTVHQVLMDDKGLTLTLVFGLAPLAHEDDPFRAVEACLRLRRQLGAKAIPISVGLATGRLFCSNYGGVHQKTFGIFGQAINVAAHLAEAAQGDIVCDATTAQAVGRRILFNLLPHLQVKGTGASVLAFSPTAVTDDFHAPPRLTIIDRISETAMLRSCLNDLKTGKGKLVLIAGEAGIGKSRLLEDFIGLAQADNHAVLVAKATAIERSTPYFVWRAVLRQILQFEGPGDGPRVRRELSEALLENESLLNWLPLLEEVIPLGFSESAFTEQIVGSARASAIEELVIFLLRRSSVRILIMEDVHWFDGPSIELLGAVARRLSEFLIVVTQRTETTAIAKPRPAVELASSLQLRLDRLSRDHVQLLVEQRLRSSEVPPELVRYVYGHASGNPFFSEELALALRDTGKIQVTRGICSFDEQNLAESSISLSTSVERAIVSRIDQLSPDDQLVLKAASAVGDSLSAELLDQIVPELSAATKAECIRRLIDFDFLQLDRKTRPLSLVFRHSITMEVAYHALSFAQRRVLHRRIAGFIEQHHAEELQPNYARLARHLELGGESLRAITYLELAAEQSRNNSANREAIRYVERLFDLTQREAIEIGSSRKAAWEVILGDAHHELSDYESSASHYQRAMELLGHRLAVSKTERIGALFRNAATQLRLRFTSAKQLTLADQDRADMQRVAHMHEFLSEQYFYQNDSLAVLNGTLASLNLAEKCGAIPETIRGYSALALGMGMSGLVGIGRTYGARAIRLAEDYGSLPEIARVRLVLGVLSYGLAEWDNAEAHGEHARHCYERLGDRKRAQNSETMLIFIALLRGDISRADERLVKLFADISDDSPPQIRAWSLSLRALIDITRGVADTGCLDKLKALAAQKLIRTEQLLCAGVAAAGYLERGETAVALELAERGLPILRECGVVWGGYAFGPAGIADVFLSHWEQASGAVSSNIESQAKLACRELSRLARTSPICRLYSLLMNGRLCSLTGQPARALKQWKRAVKAAELLQTPREQAQAIYRIGLACSESDPEREARLRHAADIFHRLGATRELAELQRVHPSISSQGSQA